MALAFNDLCLLLETVENISIRHPRLSQEQRKSGTQDAIRKWFSTHRKSINHPDANGGAILSAIFPHRRKDRVYGLKSKSLSQKLTKLLGFNHVQKALFDKWTTGKGGDLGVYTAIAMKPWDGTIKNKRTILSSYTKQRDWHVDTDTEIQQIFKRLDSGEAKWLVRLILREYCTIELDEKFVFEQFHFLLPDLLMFQNDFDAASSLLKGELSCYPPVPEASLRRPMRAEAGRKLSPTVGVKVGRPTFHKAWSFRNCFQLVGNRAWAAETKYDGEYCEIHVNLADSPADIQIFSKNGKDATKDRHALHSTIRDSLRIGQADCRIKKKCIVLGELVLYSDKENKILSFSKIRKHISRSGSFMGTLQDSLPHDWEHLMIVFFDILVLDDSPVLRQSLQERRRVLKDVMRIIPGRSMRSEWTLIDFKGEDGTTDLKQAFARTLSDRQEGLILKPLHTPYFPLLFEVGHRQPGYFIKLKKDYLNDMDGARDLGDFAIVGSSYDAQVAFKSDLKNLHWTHYHLGCLTNKSAVERIGARPKFKIVGALSIDKCIPKPELKYLNDNGYLQQVSFRPDGSTEQFDIENTYGYDRRMSVVFKRPFVAEILGSGYEKAQNESFEMLRHPRIKKIHHDRTWEDTVTMEDLERMAGERWEIPDPDALDGHAKDVALLVKKYVEETSRSQFTISEYETTQETTQRTTQYSSLRTTQESTQRNSTRTMAELAQVLEDEEVIQETPQCTSQRSWATVSSTQVSNSTQGVGIKASREVRILVREDTSERIPVVPTHIPAQIPIPMLNTAVIPTPPISSVNSSGPSTIKRRQSLKDLIISPPISKRRKIRTPLNDAGTCRNLGAFDWDSQEKTLHVYAEEGWKVQVHSHSEKRG